MEIEVRCPECGGIIDALPGSANACTCTKLIGSSRSAEPPKAGPTLADSVAPGAKICCSCGKDLTGHTRFKDSLGYWCKDCHYRDKDGVKLLACAGCGRTFPPDKLIAFDGEKRCLTCEKQRQRDVLEKLRHAAVHRTYSRFELRRVLMLAGIALVLAVLVIIATMRLRELLSAP